MLINIEAAIKLPNSLGGGALTRIKLMQLSRRQMVYNLCVVPFRKSVCLAIALVVLSVPVLACALPGQQMTEEEQACCLHMADDCSGTQMESHSCCNKLPQVGSGVFQVSNRHIPVTLDCAIEVALNLQPTASINHFAIPHVIAQPESRPALISVLRI
ncbi:MAG TPA: hypothetical protein VGN44_17405 [Candidatus Angelobacter sp.]